MRLLARLNEWRLSVGLWPYKPNETLDRMAHDQATYLLSLPELPFGGDIHLDAQGQNPRQRALRYGWPFYNTEEQVAVTEIANVGHDEDDAITFWQNSPIHRDSVVSPSYREIGIAALPYEGGGYLYIAVLGARPNVLPALVEPQAGRIYFSSERYRWSAGGDRIHEVTQVQFVPSADATPDPAAWQAWQASLPLPSEVGAAFAVIYSDGATQVTAPVNMNTDVAWLPSNLALAAGSTAPTPPTATAAATAAAAATSTPTAIAAGGGTPNVALVYTNRWLAVLNISAGLLDLSRLELVGSGRSLPLRYWDTPWLTAPLTAFPAGDCLQVWAWDQPEQPTPPGCRLVRSAIYVPPDGLFWAQGDFEVRLDGALLATCSAAAGRCEVAVP